MAQSKAINGTYGSHVSVEGPTLISEKELQALLGKRPEHASEIKAEPDRMEEQAPLKVTPKKEPKSGERNKAGATPREML